MSMCARVCSEYATLSPAYSGSQCYALCPPPHTHTLHTPHTLHTHHTPLTPFHPHSHHTPHMTHTPGRYLLVGQGSGLLGPGDGGAYVTLVPPEGPSAGFTLVVETMGKAAANATFALGGGLPGPGTTVHVWQTTQVRASLYKSKCTLN
jgi:hypothetical protein